MRLVNAVLVINYLQFAWQGTEDGKVMVAEWLHWVDLDLLDWVDMDWLDL